MARSTCVGLLVWTLQLAIVRTTLQMNAPGYLGCFTDCKGFLCNNRVLPIGPIDSDDHQSVEWCFRNCLENVESDISYNYAGLELGSECFCGNNENYGVQGLVGDSECQDRCTGNSDQICGDIERISIYRISDGVCSNDIGPPTNGAHVITNPSSVSYNLIKYKFFGTRVDFFCDSGYTLHGASSIECIETSYNNVTWSDSVPTCEVPTTSANLTTLLTTYATPQSTTRWETATKSKILPPTWESTRVPDGTNSPIAGKLGTGEIAGIAVGLLTALTVLIVAVAFLWRKRKTNDRTKEPGNVLETVGAHYETHLFSNHLSDTSADTAQNQGDSNSALGEYSWVIRPADKDTSADTAQNQGDSDSALGEYSWVIRPAGEGDTP